MRFTQILRLSASAVVLSALGAGAAHAQDEGEVTRVDEIVVTAQKREQSLQDVPIVVTALSQELLQDAGVHDIKDLTILTPGLTVTSTTSETITTARIRGVGTVGDNPGLESSVGVVIDGVFRPRNGVGFGDLGELQRIEVLKGPQGTLFGRNTSAGVINILTERPSFTPGFDGEATFGSNGAQGFAASVTGGISETVAGRAYFATRERDGFYDVITGDGPRTETDDQNQDFWTFRGQLLWLPSDSVTIRAIADYTEREEYCCTAVQIRSGPTAALVNALTAGGQGVRPAVTGGFGPGPGYAYLPFSRTGYTNRATTQNVQDRGLSLQADVDLDILGGATLTTITAARKWDSTNGQDIDFSGMDALYRQDNGDFGFGVDTFSQEFRLAGETDRLAWLVGAYYSREELERRDSYYFGSDYANYLSFLLTTAVPGGPYPGRIGCLTAPGATPVSIGTCAVTGAGATGPTFTPGQGVRDLYETETETFALFTHNTYDITEDLHLTVGLRYTMEEKALSGLQDNINGNGAVCGAAGANAAAITAAFGPAGAQQAIGLLCLPWSNFQYDGRVLSESNEEEAFSGTVNLAYDISDDLMVYGSYSRGYKGAGYNLDRVQTGITPEASLFFPAETVDSYELGMKSTLMDGSLLVNATAFHQTFSDFQLNTFLGTAFVVESIPEVTSVGLDLDAVWFTPLDGLSFQGGVTYAQTEYGDFTAADLNNPARFGPLSLLPGNQMSFAPEWSVTGAASYERAIGAGLVLGLNLAGKYTSEYNTKSDLLPAGMQDALTLWNGRISLASEDQRWAVELWGQNLTDEDYYQVVFNGPLQGTAFQSTVQPSGNFYNPALDTQTYNAFLGQPRTWGVTLRVSY